VELNEEWWDDVINGSGRSMRERPWLLNVNLLSWNLHTGIENGYGKTQSGQLDLGFEAGTSLK
jgi:hypothetical protein